MGRCGFIGKKVSHRNGDTNLTEMEINLSYGLKDKQESILINHSKSVILKITFGCTCCYFPCIAT